MFPANSCSTFAWNVVWNFDETSIPAPIHSQLFSANNFFTRKDQGPVHKLRFTIGYDTLHFQVWSAGMIDKAAFVAVEGCIFDECRVFALLLEPFWIYTGLCVHHSFMKIKDFTETSCW